MIEQSMSIKSCSSVVPYSFCSYRNLWAAVVSRSIQDLILEQGNQEAKAAATAFFLSKHSADKIGSWKWCIQTLELSAQTIKQAEKLAKEYDDARKIER